MSTKPGGIHRLSDKQATGAKPKDRPYRLRDGAGLYLEIAITGRKRWGLRIEAGGKRSDVNGIGIDQPGHHEHVSLADARERARGLRAEPFTKAKVPTFKEYAQQVIAMRSPSWKNAVASAQWPSTLEQYVYPVFGHVPVDEVSASQIRAAIEPIWHSKPESAKKILQRVGAVLEAAVGQELRTKATPTRGVRSLLGTQKNPVTHHRAMAYAHAPRFVSWLHSECRSEPVVRHAMEWLVLHATRVRETLDADWSEIDRDAKVWRIQRHRMKRPDRSGEPFVIPLSPRALAILATAERWKQGDGGLIFPTKRGALDTNVLRSLILRGQWVDCTAHGFRSTFRSWASERWASPIADKGAVVESALDHIPGKVERAYHRSRYLEERSDHMDKWAAFLATPAADDGR